MNTKLKQYSIGAILVILGIAIGALAFSTDKTAESHEHSTSGEDNEKVWTCSMHPQIRQDEAGDCPICGMDLIPAGQLESGIDPDAIKMSKTARALAKVETISLGQSAAQSSNMSYSGQLVVNQDRVESLSANYKGRIEKLYINEEGEQVNKDQLIAEIYAPEIQILKDEYNLALKQDNLTLINSVNRKIKNLELTINDVKQMENGILKLRAPKTGIVTRLFINQGDNIKADQQLFQIADFSSLWANLDIYENDLNTLKIGDQLNINIPNQSNVKGKVTFISPSLDNNTRSATARVVINNNDLNLKPGVFISAKLEKTTENTEKVETLMLPKSAVLWTGERSVVYQEIKDESGVYYKMREVKTGKTSDDAIEILSGISAGDVIVTQGAFSIDSEAQLADKPSMMNLKSKPSKTDEKIELDNNYLEYYFELKDALVKDDFEKAKSIGKEFSDFLKNQKTDEQIFEKLSVSLNEMISKSDIEAFRDEFIQFSDEIIRITQSIDIEQKIYVQYCPMADSNEGAYWLSLDKSIRNPYFGASMLKCGEVKEVIEPL